MPAPVLPVIMTAPPMISVTPTTLPVPVSIAASTVTYAQILQSLGTFVYGGEFIYMYSPSYTQVGQPMAYNHFDANGNAITSYLPFVIDPFQSQSAVYYETNPTEVVLDGFSALSFTLQANNSLYFKTFTLVTADPYFLNETNLDEFQKLEEAQGIKFFDDYCNYLIDSEDGTTQGTN